LRLITEFIGLTLIDDLPNLYLITRGHYSSQILNSNSIVKYVHIFTTRREVDKMGSLPYVCYFAGTNSCTARVMSLQYCTWPLKFNYVVKVTK
jgi:hypothetical protein